MLELVAADPSLASPITGAEPSGCRDRYAATQEGALHIDDVLTRRTHIAFEAPDSGERAAAEGGAGLMAPVLGWDEATLKREVAHYQDRLVAEAAAQALWTDADSDSAGPRCTTRAWSKSAPSGQVRKWVLKEAPSGLGR